MWWCEALREVERGAAAGLLDLRTSFDFAGQHLRLSTSLPFDCLATRVCALPPRDTDGPPRLWLLASSVRVIDDAANFLECWGYAIAGRLVPSTEEWAQLMAEDLVSANDDEGGKKGVVCCTGLASSWRLWQPNDFLARITPYIEEAFIHRAIASNGDTNHTNGSLEFDGGTALDLACGVGRDAVWLALRGWHVVAVDHTARRLQFASALAAAEDVGSRVPTVESDLVAGEAIASLKPADLVHVARFLHRPLLPSIAGLVNSGGFVVYHTFMEPSLGKPRKAKHLLRPRELVDAPCFARWHVVEYTEGKLSDGRPVQFFCARKPNERCSCHDEGPR